MGLVVMERSDMIKLLEDFRKQIVDELRNNLVMPSANVERRLLDRDGVAKILGVSKPTVDRYRNKVKGFPKPIEVFEGKPMWDSQDIFNFIERKKQERREKDEKKQEFSFS